MLGCFQHPEAPQVCMVNVVQEGSLISDWNQKCLSHSDPDRALVLRSNKLSQEEGLEGLRRLRTIDSIDYSLLMDDI